MFLRTKIMIIIVALFLFITTQLVDRKKTNYGYRKYLNIFLITHLSRQLRGINHIINIL